MPKSYSMYQVANQYLVRNMNSFENTYILEKQKLGFGSFGDVKLCRDKQLSTVRAVKIINKDYLRSANIESSWFYNKIDILNRLDHPLIIKFHEFFETRDFFYLLMDYQQEGDLLARLKSRTAFHEPLIRRLMKQLLTAIAYMHNMKIAHRDIKPENILISSSDLTIKLIDFDTAAKFEGNDLTGAMGTFHFMAPEISSKRYNEKCDVWSCGIIMYILITRKANFQGLTDNKAPKKTNKLRLDFSKPFWQKVSDAGKDLIKQLLQHDPKKRISAMEALRHPWFNESQDDNYEPTRQLLLKIIDYTGKPLVKAAKKCVIHLKSPSADFSPVEKAFIYLDNDCDGELTIDDFVNFFLVTQSKAQAESQSLILMQKLAEPGSPFIKYSEFLEVAVDEMILATPQSLRFFYDILCKGSEKLYLETLSTEYLKTSRLREEELKVWIEYLQQSTLIHLDFGEFSKLVLEGLAN